MLIFCIILVLVNLILAYCLYYIIRQNFHLNDKIDAIYHNVNNSLTLLDEYYNRAFKRSKLETFQNDPIIREHINDLKNMRNVILQIANMLIEQFSGVNNDDNRNND